MADETTTLPDPLITSDPDRLGGTPCFAGTRVPVQTLFEYIEGGETLDEFVKDFPSISREQAIAVLKASRAALLAAAIERNTYVASEDELAAIDRARGQMAHGQKATVEEVKAALARFKS